MPSNAIIVAKKVMFQKNVPTQKSISLQRNVSTAVKWDIFLALAQKITIIRTNHKKGMPQNVTIAVKWAISLRDV